jgi:DNA-binding NarL/FixJ family response regulator
MASGNPDAPRHQTSADQCGSRPIDVMIVEDQREIREGLARLIDRAVGFRCVGRHRSMEEALAARPIHPPAVALLDIGLPGMSGIAGIEPLKRQYPGVLVLMITVHEDDERIFDAMCAGACGYLLKKTPPEKLVESVREVVAGGAPMSPEVARRVVELFRTFHPPERADYHLTPHELRLLGMLVDGHNYKTAASELGVTVHAVSFHMRHVYEKLRVHSKSEAVARALRDRLLP